MRSRCASQMRTPAQRRLASSGTTAPGMKDNAFNRERQAVKEHAAATSGKRIGF